MRPQPEENLIAQAAELRAAGASWPTIAAKVERDPDTCRKWPMRYPAEWNRYFLGARKTIIHQLGVESTGVLQQMLRSDNTKLRQDTAKFVSRSDTQMMMAEVGRPAETKDHDGELKEYLEFLATLDETQQLALFDELAIQRVEEIHALQSPAATEPHPAVGE